MVVHYEIRTTAGAVLHQFVNQDVMERWLVNNNLNYLPNYQIFKVIKQEELVYDHSDFKTTAN